MGTQKDGGLVSRAVREALGTLVSPHVYGQLVARALSAAGLTAIPESGRAVADWISGPLLREVEQAVGSDGAELVSAQLAAIVAHAAATPAAPSASQERPAGFGSDKPTGIAVAQLTARARREQQKSTARIQLTPAQLNQLGRSADDGRHTTRPQAVDGAAGRHGRVLPRVLAVTAESRAVRALEETLANTAAVLQVTDLVALLDALDEPGLQSPIVLLDCQRPAVHVTSIAAMCEDLPRGTTIVLWGASEESWRELNRERGASCRWVRCSHEATTDDVGSLCAMLIG